MKARELMIGDWVQTTFMGNNVPCKVVGISTDITIEYQNCARKYEALKDVEPIPLSEEILDRNFKPSNHEGDYPYAVKTYYIDECCENNDYDLILCEDNQCTLTDHVFITIKYVHELQHLLKVCGIDKEVVL